jgi:hypothetical protein
VEEAKEYRMSEVQETILLGAKEIHNLREENKKQKEILHKIKEIIKKVKDDEFYINLTNKEKALYEIERLLEEKN